MGLNNMEVSKSLKNQPFGKFRYQNKQEQKVLKASAPRVNFMFSTQKSINIQ